MGVRVVMLLWLSAFVTWPLQALADSTGEQFPTVSSGAFTHAADALACDNMTDQFTTTGQTQTFSVYGLSVPSTAIINGIQVRVRANDGGRSNRKLQVSLSWNAGTSFTAALATRNFRKNSPLKDYLVGGSAVLWGRTWSPSEFLDGNFRVRLLARMQGGTDPINVDCVPVTVFYHMPGAPNLNISKSDSPDPVQPGQTLTYTIAYSNTGASTATNVVISDQVPANTTFVSGTPTPASVDGMGIVTWNIGALAVGASGTVTLVVQVAANLLDQTLLTNSTYSIASDQNAATGGNAITTTVTGTVALTLTKTDSPDPVEPGGTLTYVLTIGNGGNSRSMNVVVDETYDGNVTYVSDESTCAGISGGNDQWTITSLDGGASCTITIKTKVSSGVADGTLLFNSAAISDDAAHTAEANAITTVHVNCGDGTLQDGEACDNGPDNGTASSCCTASCTFRASGETCRPVAGVCDSAETCTGSSGTCPADAKSTALCRAAAAFCDVAESCDGSSNDCPADDFEPATTVCRPAAGPCDTAETCTGFSASCPSDAKGTALCRAAAGVCDVAESCDGSSNDCPADDFEPATTVCRPAAGPCDTAETCTGFSASCPSDVKSTATCRAAATSCDVAESCDGSGNDCPADAFASDTTICRAAAGVCDVPETCTGSSATCPNDMKSTAVCRAAAGSCDVAESCNGDNDDCPSDAVKASGFVCNPGSGDLCDPDETCDGIGSACPGDTVAPAGTVCRAGSGDLCDPDEVCGGNADEACPPDAMAIAGTLCRAGSGDSCDPDEVCPGTAGQACPTDVVASDATVCRAGSGDVCDPSELCPGVPGEPCAADVVLSPTAVCRSGSGDACDPDEFCPGLPGGTCAADVIAPAGTVCNLGSGDLCDPDETCSGTAGEACPADTVAPSTTICRAAAGPCDTAEHCSGTANAGCPTDAKLPSGTVCRAASAVCDAVEVCDGTANTCPTDAALRDGTACSDGLYCNGAETCQSGTCINGTVPCAAPLGCNEASDSCTGVCPAEPRTCRKAQKSLLLIKNKGDDNKDKLVWKFIKGEATTLAEFSDPLTSATYALCIYAGASPSLVAEMDIPPGGKWAATGTKGFKYVDATLAADGAQKVNLKSGIAGKSKALVKGRGVNLPDPIDDDPLSTPITVQLLNAESALCWQGSYTAAKKNTTAILKAKQ